MKIFIGHSFKDEDKDIVERIKRFIQSSKFECITGEQSEILSVSQKVQERIKKCDIFIGIFTREKPLEHSIFKKPSAYTTSAWVIQESGYALANCKKVIFLFEDMVITRLGLQSDSEYLVFDRNEPLDNMFVKLNEMLVNSQNNNCSIVNNENIELESENITVEKEDTLTNNDIDIHKIDLEINLDYSKDYDLVKKSYEELIKTTEDEETKIIYESTFLYRSELLGKNGNINKLYELSKTYPNNVFIKQKLAEYNKKLEAFEQAAILFKELSEITKEDIKQYAKFVYQEYNCISSYKGYEEALLNIEELLSENKNNKYLYKSIAMLAHDNKDWNNFFNYAECYIKREPNDTDIRFKLAYAYSEQKRKNLSFYHYKILNNTSKSGTYYNNIGVLYNEFGLNIQSVNAYLKAIELDESLSISNLANQYINSGFINDAKTLLAKVEDLKQRHISIHSNIGNTESRLKKAEQNEVEKETAIFSEAQQENHFMLEYAEKYCTPYNIDYSKLSGTWKTHQGEHKFEFKQDFECIFKIKIKSETDYTEFGIKGKINNLSFYSSMKTRECHSYSNNNDTLFRMILGSLPGDKTYGIISEDYSTIKICTIDEKGIAHYYTWEKVS